MPALVVKVGVGVVDVRVDEGVCCGGIRVASSGEKVVSKSMAHVSVLIIQSEEKEGKR